MAMITKNLGRVVGPDGKSAYQLWLELGNTGTEQDFFNSIKGSDGKNGSDGTNGANGKDGKGISKIEKTATVGLVDTYTITYTDGTKSTYNVTNGKDGADGTSGSGTNSALAYLKTLKCGIMGDSITYGAGINHNTESYPALLKAEFKDVINYGINATFVTYKEGDNKAMCIRYADMADDLDVIIVMGGTNDFASRSGEGTFGEPDSMDYTTFYGALNVLMKGLVEKYLGKEIFFCTPIHINYNGLKSSDVRTNGKNLYDYRNAIIERCAAHSIHCIDIFGISGMDIENSEIAKDYFTWDGCHPNVIGAKRLHDKILNEVINCIGNNAPAEIVTPVLSSITATFTQGDTAVYIDTTLSSLKPMLNVIAKYSDGSSKTITDYTLEGTLSIGTSVVTVNYGGKSTTFNVVVSESTSAELTSISAVYTQGDKVVYDTDSLESLKNDLVVTAHYDDETSTIISDYTLEGTLAEGTSIITVNYENKTVTFSVVVIKSNISYTYYDALIGDAASYINTGVNPTHNTKFEMKFDKTSYSGQMTPLQVWTDNKYWGPNGNGNTLYWCWNNQYPAVDITFNVNSYLFRNDKGTLYNNDVEIGNIEDAEFTMTAPIYLFAKNQGTRVSNISGDCLKVYYCKIWEGDILIRDFVPAKRDTDGAIGMLDKVNNVFYTNQGTGTFTGV